MTRLTPSTGFSLIEVAVTLTAFACIAGVLSPSGFDLIRQAQDLQASRDALSIRHAIVRLLDDTGAVRFATRGPAGDLVEMLVSGGETPQAGMGDPRWTRGVDERGLVDLLDRHLVTNDPGGDPAQAWPTPTRVGRLGWRGAYLTQGVGADPWGRRYAINVKYLTGRNEVIVLSAGPNGIVETPFEGQGLRAGGDDVAVLLR